MHKLLQEIRACRICEKHLPHKPKPVLNATPKSKIAIIGQAPGSVVHKSGIPWDDKSGDRLRNWLNIDQEQFYNPNIFAIIPMGFCYPGKGKSGDLPPRKECAPQWHPQLFSHTKNLDLIILIGCYAQDFYLAKNKMPSLTETVKNYQNYLPKYFPLPHPSPRNNIWLRKNAWFEQSVIPKLQAQVHGILTD